MEIRKIATKDILEVETLIQSVMTAYDCVGEGYSINDPEVSDMYAAYNSPKSVYYVVEEADKILGGAGIGPLAGGGEDTCELKKMYFYPKARGKGVGSQMLTLLLEEARSRGYKKCYLETVDRMKKANQLYNKFGFKKLDSQEGGTGHCGCDTFYILEL